MLYFRFVFLLLFIRFLLDFSYVNFVFKYYNYAGFNYDFDINQYVLSIIMYLLCIPLCSLFLKKVSDYFFLSACMFFYAPITSLFGLDSARDFYVVFLCLSSLYLMYYFINHSFVSFKNVPYINGGGQLAIYLSIFFMFLVLSNFLLSGASLNFDLDAVYQFRDQNAKLAEVGIFTYLNNWTYSIFTLYIFAICLKNSRFFLLAFFLSLQVVFFGFSAHKAVLFMPFLVIGAWYYFKKERSLIILPFSISFSLLVCVVLFLYFDDIQVSGLYVRRVFFVPAQLTFAYVDFFNQNEFTFWSQSIMKYFIDYPYEQGISSLIGNWMFNDDTRANNGLVSSGYANFGAIGVYIYSLLLALIIKMIDDFSLSGNMPTWFAISLIASPLNVALIQSDLFTAALTHGLLIALLLVYISRAKVIKETTIEQ
ncbi:hypothetical protein PSOS111911_11760 [Pseudoalteromonas ostreae]